MLTLRRIRQAPNPETARRVIADALPPELVALLSPDQIELMRQKLQQSPGPSRGRRLTKRDWTGALGLCLLSFLSTFPVVIPFLFLSDARLALRASYAIAIVMLFSLIGGFAGFTIVNVLTTGGPLGTTHVLGTAAFLVGIAGGNFPMGAAVSLCMVPILAVAATLILRSVARRGTGG